MIGFLFSNTTTALFAVVSVSIYFYVKYLYSYWQRRGVLYLKPSFPFGNFAKSFKQKLSMGELVDEFYRSTTEPFIGVYSLFTPTLIACGSDFVKNILIKDFHHFVDRGVYIDEKNDPISASLFSLTGDTWKNLRQKLTPTFTTGKMKAIFSTLLDSKNPLQNYMEQVADTAETIEMREISARYTTNSIASVAFGIDIDCFADPDTPFRKYGRQFFEFTWRNAFRFICFSSSPQLLKWSGVGVVDKEVNDFMYDMVRQTLEMREKNNIVRKDFFQFLVQLRNTGTVQLDDEWQTVIKNDNTKALTIDEITAQAFLFYAAGFETTSSTMSFCLYELAKNAEIQRKVQEEIDAVLARHEGQFTYRSISELKYLECCIDEALRKYPVPFLSRVCVKDYKVAGTNITIEKGTSVIIPVFSLHRDEKYYPKPDQFDPTRFFPENRCGKTILDMPYMPFGEGPRNCIGMRMGRMSTMVGIISVLQKYTVELGKQHIGHELEFLPAASGLAPKNGIHLKIRRRF